MRRLISPIHYILKTGYFGHITLLLLFVSSLTFSPIHILSFAASPIASSGLETQISEPMPINGMVQYNITGGTHTGTNLFHSFSEFSVPNGHIANFLNDSNSTTSNILGRVTGDNSSNIFGTIQTTGFDSANLFLMNPNGIVFGPNASLHVGGSVTFTTANYLRLAEINGAAGVFHADTALSSILTSAPVTAFGFLNSTQAAIAVQGSRLSVSNGEALSLVGGNQGFDYINPDTNVNATVPDGITITGGKLSASNGQINLAGVASRGEISAVNFMPATGMTMGNISLSQNTLLDVSATRAGTVRIRGGQLTIADATLSADTGNASGSPVAIDISLTGDLSISDTRAFPAITARTSGTGNAGRIEIVSANMQASSTDPNFAPFALIDTHSSGAGSAGSVNITTGNLTVTGPATTWHFVDSGPRSGGSGGNITLAAQERIELTGTTISTGTQLAEIFEAEASGPAGNIILEADSLQTDRTHFLTTAAFEAATQQAGNTTINVHTITMSDSSISAAGFFGGGGITINADSLITNATKFDTFTAFGPAHGISFNGRILELTKGSNWSTSTFGDENAGDIHIIASDHTTLVGDGGTVPSGLFSNSFGEFGTKGGSGNITVETPSLLLREGRINTSTATSGRGGDITIEVNKLEISGEFPFPDTGGFFGITDIHPSGLFTQTVGTNFCPSTCGNAGNILITADSMRMASGSQINSGTTNTGHGGTITVETTNRISMSGMLTDGSPVGVFSRTIGTAPDAGAGGNISLTAGQSVTIQDGASVSASSTGSGNAGNIFINAGQQLEVSDNSSITTQAAKASGGNIDIRAIDRIRFVNSTVSTSVLAEDGKGGNIFIDPNVVILEGSEVTAKAVGGAGGNITFVTPLFLADSASLSRLSAKSESGLNGTVLIQSPTSNLSGAVGQLASKTSPPQVLLQNRCIALAGGEQSTFILAGRDALPSEPGGWLSSPVAMEHWTGEETEEHVSGLMVRSRGWNTQPVLVMSKDETTVLSLRRLTPPDFLVRSFAGHAPTGCSS